MDHAALHKMISEIPAPSKTGVQKSGTRQGRLFRQMFSGFERPATLHGVVFDILAARTFAEAVSALRARASGVRAQRLTLPGGG
jgi:hypothetical protein